MATKSITRAELRTSGVACRRIEDEIIRRLRAVRIANDTPSSIVIHALNDECIDPPDWCEAEAWDRMVDGARAWAVSNGNLGLWIGLRGLKDEQVEGFLRQRRVR